MDAFKNAPKVEGDDFLKDANEGWDASFMTYWKDFVTSTPGGTDTTGTGSQGYTPASVMNFGLACKDFADFNIVDKNGEKVGEVDDLVVDVKGSQIAYLVVDMENSDNMVLVPFSAVSIVKGKGVNLLGGAKNDFQLTVDTDTFNSAPTFTDYTEFNTFTSGWDEQLKTYWKDFIHTTPVNP
jgi:sporulation protein YlmC with PRC-barrel domain